MDIKAYIYIDSYDGTMCFHCAVKEIIEFQTSETPQFLLKERNFDLTLEIGDTDSGCDMRSTPRCVRCNEVIKDHYIA